MEKRILIPLADKFDEISLASFVTILGKAGIEVTLAGTPGKIITSNEGITVVTEKRIEDVNPDVFDSLVLVGGACYEALMQSSNIWDIIKKFNSDKKLIVGVCESPAILSKAGLLENKLATISPGMERLVAKPRDKNIIVEDNIMTVRSTSDCMEAAFKVVEFLLSKDKADDIRAYITGSV